MADSYLILNFGEHVELHEIDNLTLLSGSAAVQDQDSSYTLQLNERTEPAERGAVRVTALSNARVAVEER